MTIRSLAFLIAMTLTLAGCGGDGSQSAASSNPTPAPVPQPPPPTAATYSLVFSTLLDGASGNGYEMVRDIAIDAQGFIYVTGGTTAPDFPTTAGAYDRTFGGGGNAVGSQGASDVFVTKMTPDGKIVWSTFLGGPNYDRAYAIRVGADGSVYVAGRAGPGFPTTTGVVQPNFAGDSSPLSEYGKQDGFVAKLSADGSKLIWSTYVGDAGGAIVRDLDVDAQGRAYLAVINVSQPMPVFITANARQSTVQDQEDGAYVRLSADATRVEYGTYFGGSPGFNGASTGAASIRVGADYSVVIAFADSGPGLATTANAYQPRPAGGSDLVVEKFAANDQIAFETYLGGSKDDTTETHFLALDTSGNIYLTGATASPDYPVTAGALQRQLGGKTDTFVSILAADGSRLIASTYLGGSGDELGQGIAVAHRNGLPDAVVLSASSSSANLPITAGAYQAMFGGGQDAVLAVFAPDLTSLRYLTLLGGSAEDNGRAVAITPDASSIYIGGHTLSSGFPTTSGALDRTIDGLYAAWVAAFRLN